MLKVFFKFLNFLIMLNNILNLEGVTVLNKKQQNSINGSGGYCRLTIRHANGSTETGGGYFGGGSGSEISGNANAFCSSVVQNDPDISRCFYDCAHDGFGQ